MRITVFFCSILLLVALSACNSKSESTSATSQPQAGLTPIDPATAGSISGNVKFSGTLPKAQQIDMSQDPACGNKPNFDESFVVSNGALANAFIYVKKGLEGRSFPAVSTVAKITQQNCRYTPHVMGIVAGQPVQIINADQTTHNIHPMPTASKQWNESQLPNDQPIQKTFNKPELMIPVKCNQHPWMRMYLNVVSNPLFAVTGPDGRFEIKGLPPGEYTIAAVHEKMGEQEMKVTIGPKETKSADFAFVNSHGVEPRLQ
ncbi:MAG TPA: carboxypeptidase regulatory-like domain-containing protein [Terriglobales bacterium]|nr:carboxypeptidase regulatory-like domain-containing protein [Terriglobales bacterium]